MPEGNYFYYYYAAAPDTVAPDIKIPYLMTGNPNSNFLKYCCILSSFVADV
jgi:hypothetical protein